MTDRAYLELAALAGRGCHYQKNSNGTCFLHAASLTRLGVRHGFSTRMGGVSAPPYASLNLSWTRHGTEQEVIDNYHIFAAGENLCYEDFVIVNHEHGNRVLHVDAEDRGKGFSLPPLPYCDGIVTDNPAVTLVTGHADCDAYFVYDPVKRAAGLAHAGWRGNIARIGAAVVQKMREEFGSDPSNLYVSTGACICKDCFEVDEPLADDFVREFGVSLLKAPGKPGKAYVDLAGAALIQFAEAGVPAEHVTLTGACTYSQTELFFSNRRDRGVTGSMAAYIRV